MSKAARTIDLGTYLTQCATKTRLARARYVQGLLGRHVHFSALVEDVLENQVVLAMLQMGGESPTWTVQFFYEDLGPLLDLDVGDKIVAEGTVAEVPGHRLVVLKEVTLQ